MLKAKKKISKRELKQDKLVTTLAQAENFYVKNKKYITYGAGAIVALVIIAFIYSNNRKADDEKASVELSKISQQYQMEQYDAAINGVPEKNIMGLQKIVDNYGSSESGEQAKIFLARCYYATGKYEEALKYFSDYGGGMPELKSAALSGAAACYEIKKDYAKAAELFEKAGNKYPTVPTAPGNLINAARTCSLAGDHERARMLLKKIKTDFSKSPEAREVDRLIALLPS